MGTNFHWQVERTEIPMFDDDDPSIHIGKRSAAGLYCWDCSITLCIDGDDAIHKGRSKWYDVCPCCGQGKSGEDTLSRGSVAVELGFAAPESRRPVGVSSAASFSWAQHPERVGTICRQHPCDAIIEDEYHHSYTGDEFLQMLEYNCPIQFTDSIGQWFS